MDTVDARSTVESVEVERSQVHPINQVDNVLYALAAEDFKDNPQVQNVLQQMSDELFSQAQSDRDYFTGQAPDWKYKGFKKESIRPGWISPAYHAGSLQRLGPHMSEVVAEAIAKKLGAIPEGHTLKELEGSSNLWQPPTSEKMSYTGRWITIPLTSAVQNPPLSNDRMDSREFHNPLVDIVKNYYYNQYGRVDNRPGQPGTWSLVVRMHPAIFVKSFDLPLAPSKFPAPNTSQAT